MGNPSMPPHFVIFDTEYTTWEGARERAWTGPGEYREIVQIGAVLVNGETLAEKRAFLCHVQPIKNPKVSEYFTDLTGITQKELDEGGIPYTNALELFADWAQGWPLYCWGMDFEIMAYNAKLVDIPFPLSFEQKHDVRSVFELEGIATTAYMSSTIPRAFGEEPPPSAHDALNDARSILQALRALRRRVS